MNRQQVERYLSSLLKQPATVSALTPLGELRTDPTDAKRYGYGTPIRVDYTCSGESRTAVIHTMAAGPFGHEHMADRAQILLWQHRAFNHLPRHVRALDVGGIDAARNLTSLGCAEEFYLLTDYAEGQCYAKDLDRIRSDGIATPDDFARADALCDWLCKIHREPVNQPDLYVRRIRELVGHGECIMGLADSYPEHPVVTRAVLEQIEHRAVAWRWRLKSRTQRLRQVHGDFHPWNILFETPLSGATPEFQVLDRSRGEYGDPADDVTSITANYFFFSLQRSGRLEGAFAELFLRFWNRYLDTTGDREILEVAAPFFAFRGLVMASPLWYPDLSETTRQKLVRFILAVLAQPVFDPDNVNGYCEA
jgi:hypothetical protein